MKRIMIRKLSALYLKYCFSKPACKAFSKLFFLYNTEEKCFFQTRARKSFDCVFLSCYIKYMCLKAENRLFCNS